MKIIVTKDQLTEILSNQSNVKEQEDPTDAQPTSGASDKQSGSDGYPEVTTWSNIVGSKLTRGVANPIGNEPRPDLVNRDGPANQITEQNIPIMKLGMRGSNIGQLQQLLIKNGYKNISNNGQPDNIFGSKTQAAVIQFQKDRGLPVDGQVGPITWKALVTPKTNTSQRNDMFVAPDIKAKQGDYLSSVNALNQEKVRMSKYTYMKPGDKKRLYVEFTPSTINNALLDVREFWFGSWGIITQIVIDVAGSALGGVGGVILTQSMNVLLTINDIDLFAERGLNTVPPNNIVGAWDRFVWMVKNNEDFQRLMVDAVIMLSFGIGTLFKGAIKGAEAVLEFFGKYSEDFGKACEWIANIFSKIKGYLGKLTALPKIILDWLRDKIAAIDKIVVFFEKLAGSSNSLYRVAATLPKGFAIGAVATLGMYYGQKTLSLLSGGDTETLKRNPEKILSDFGKDINQIKNNLKNPKVVEQYGYKKALTQFPGLSRGNFKITPEKINLESIFIINNQKYYYDGTQFTKI